MANKTLELVHENAPEMHYFEMKKMKNFLGHLPKFSQAIPHPIGAFSASTSLLLTNRTLVTADVSLLYTRW